MQESKYGHVRTYGWGLECLLVHMYARARVHGWVETEKLRRRRVHGEPTGWVRTECVALFIGSAWMEQPMETRPGVPQDGGNGLVFDRPHSKRDPVYREGSGVPQNRGNGPPTVETGVLLIGRGVANRKMDETDLLRSKWGSC